MQNIIRKSERIVPLYTQTFASGVALIIFV